MCDQDWNMDGKSRWGVFERKTITGHHGEQVEDDDFYLIFIAHHDFLSFALPGPEWGKIWEVVLDTCEGIIESLGEKKQAGQAVQVKARLVMVLRVGK